MIDAPNRPGCKRIPLVFTLCTIFLLSPCAYGNNNEPKGNLSWITAFPESRTTLRQQLESLNLKIKQEPDSAQLYVKRGAALLGLHEFENAIDDFTIAIDKADIDEAYYGRGIARGRIQLYDAAISDLDVYIERHPESSTAYTKRGIRKLWSDDQDAAKADFKKAIKLDVNNAEASDDLGVIYAQEGQYDLAIKQFKHSIRMDPAFHKAYHNLAMVYYLTDQNLLALASVNQGIEIFPASRNSLLLKAEVLKALGETEHAEQIIDQARHLHSSDWSERVPVE